MHEPKPFKTLKGNEATIIHFPGKASEIYADIIDDVKNTFINVRPVPAEHEYTIVSPITPNWIDKSPLHYQLTHNNINYINPAENFTGNWHRNTKPQTILEGLYNVTTPYCLILDGNDVVIAKDLGDFTKYLDKYKVKILFNATPNRFPNLEVDHVPNRDELGSFRYLNAGVVFGETKELLKLYETVCDEINSDISNIDSEQYYVRRYFERHKDIIWFDHECYVFQPIAYGLDIK